MTVCVDHEQKGNKKGYAMRQYNGVAVNLHRLVYCKYHDIDLREIQGLVVRHTCDNTRCINPQHLLIGTHQDNADDRKNRKRTCYGESRPAAVLTADNVLYIRKHYKPYCAVHGGTALAKLYGVSRSTFWAALTGKTWQHL